MNYHLLLLGALMVVVQGVSQNSDSKVAHFWSKLNLASNRNDLNQLESIAEKAGQELDIRDAAQILENAALTWNDPRHVGAVGLGLKHNIAQNQAMFKRCAFTMIDSHPQASCNQMIAPFLKGYERLVDTTDWVKRYLKNIADCEAVEVTRTESRDSGEFPRNFFWAITSFRRGLEQLHPWIPEWAERIIFNRDPGYILKHALIQFYPAAMLLTTPKILPLFFSNIRLMTEQYSMVNLHYRIEAVEYLLWLFRIGDDFQNIPDDLRKALKFIIDVMVVPRTERCDAAIIQSAKTDAFRTLSLIWQFARCPGRIYERSVLNAIEDRAPFTFAVYLTHGQNVKRAELQTHSLSKVHRLMLNMIPKKEDGRHQWMPCKSKKPAALTTYSWSPPLELNDFEPEASIFIIRFLLYSQFGIPFDDTRTDSKTHMESFNWAELPGVATTLLERHCSLNKKYPNYKITIRGLPSRLSSSAGDVSDPLNPSNSRWTSTWFPRNPPNSFSSSMSSFGIDWSSSRSGSVDSDDDYTEFAPDNSSNSYSDSDSDSSDFSTGDLSILQDMSQARPILSEPSPSRFFSSDFFLERSLPSTDVSRPRRGKLLRKRPLIKVFKQEWDSDEKSFDSDDTSDNSSLDPEISSQSLSLSSSGEDSERDSSEDPHDLSSDNTFDQFEEKIKWTDSTIDSDEPLESGDEEAEDLDTIEDSEDKVESQESSDPLFKTKTTKEQSTKDISSTDPMSSSGGVEDVFIQSQDDPENASIDLAVEADKNVREIKKDNSIPE